jgi:WD40 repeat protein
MDSTERRQLQRSERGLGGFSPHRLSLRLLSQSWRLAVALINMPFGYIFGRDIFISYSRWDSREYAPNLALIVQKRYQEQHNRKLSVYLDRWIAPPSGRLPLSLRLQLRWSSMLVLICTEKAVESDFVKDEVARYAKLRRKVLAVDVDGVFQAVRKKEPWVSVSGADPEAEVAAAVKRAEPSKNVVERILMMAEFTTQDRRLRTAVWGTIAFVALSVGGTALFSVLTVRSARATARAAEELAAAADARATDASAKATAAEARVTLAQKSEKQANEAQATAERNARAAVQREADAKTQMVQAQQLERVAREGAAVAMRQEKGSRATVIARAPGREFEAVELALSAAQPELDSKIEPAEQVIRGLVTSISAVDYSISLADVPGDVSFTQIAPDGSKVIGKINDPLTLNPSWVLWTTNSGNATVFPRDVQLAKNDRIYSASFSRDGKRFVISDGSLRLWDLSSPTPVRLDSQCDSALGHLRGAALNSDGRELLVLDNSEVKLCKLDSGVQQTLKLLPSQWEAAPREPRFEPHSVGFTVRNEPAVGGAWEDPVTRKTTNIIYFPRTGQRIDVKTPGERLVGFGEGSIMTMKSRWSRTAEIHLQNFQNEVQTLSGYKGRISSAAIMGKRVFVVTITGGKLRVSDARSSPTFAALRSHEQTIRAVRFSPDGRFAASVGGDNARLWDASIGYTLLHTLRMPQFSRAVPGTEQREQELSNLEDVAFSPDGSVVATVRDDGQVQTWNTSTGRPVCEALPAPEDYNLSVEAVSFFDGNDVIVTAQSGSMGMITFWSAVKCERIKRVFTNTNSLSLAVFSPRGTNMLTVGSFNSDYRNYAGPPSREVKRWDIRSIYLQKSNDAVVVPKDFGFVTGNESLQAVIGDDFAQSALGSLANGSRSLVASGSTGKPLRIWRPTNDLHFGLHFSDLKDGQDFSFAVFSADGTRLAALVGTQVLVWDPRTGRLLVSIECDPETNDSRPLALSSDGSRLMVASRDHTVRIYPTSFQGFLEVGRRLAARKD